MLRKDEGYVEYLASLGCVDPEVTPTELPRRRGGRRGRVGKGIAAPTAAMSASPLPLPVSGLPLPVVERDDDRVFERTVRKLEQRGGLYSRPERMTSCMTPDWTPGETPLGLAPGRDIEVDGGGTWELNG